MDIPASGSRILKSIGRIQRPGRWSGDDSLNSRRRVNSNVRPILYQRRYYVPKKFFESSGLWLRLLFSFWLRWAPVAPVRGESVLLNLLAGDGRWFDSRRRVNSTVRWLSPWQR